jgi:hypothetical protein
MTFNERLNDMSHFLRINTFYWLCDNICLYSSGILLREDDDAHLPTALNMKQVYKHWEVHPYVIRY